MRSVFIISTAIVFGMLVGAAESNAPKSPLARAAIARAEKSEAAALTAYRKAVVDARNSLLTDLKAARKKALDSGAVDEATAIAEYEKKTQEQLDQDNNEDSRPIVVGGVWDVRYTNKVRRTYRFDRGKVSYVSPDEKQDQIQMRSQGAQILLNFVTENKVERWTFVGNKAIVEHFNPGNDFPKGRPVEFAVALREE